MKEHYTINVAGLERDLPLFKISEDLCIAAFIIFGDVELTCACARDLIKIAPDHDILITAEAKSIPLIHEMARQLGHNDYVVARKAPKLYMKDILSVNVNSITTEKEQTLCIGEDEVKLLKGRRVLIIDDVISTGESLRAVEELVLAAGGLIVGKMAVLAEGDAKDREDIKFLEPLPLFHEDGTPIA